FHHRYRRFVVLQERSPDGFAINGINPELRVELTASDGLGVDSPWRAPCATSIAGNLYQDMQRTRIAACLASYIIVLVQGIYMPKAVCRQCCFPVITCREAQACLWGKSTCSMDSKNRNKSHQQSKQHGTPRQDKQPGVHPCTKHKSPPRSFPFLSADHRHTGVIYEWVSINIS